MYFNITITFLPSIIIIIIIIIIIMIIIITIIITLWQKQPLKNFDRPKLKVSLIEFSYIILYF